MSDDPGTFKARAWLPVTSEIIDDLRLRDDVNRMLTEMFSIALHPWIKPDRNPMPTFDLFPRLTRAQRLANETRARFADAIDAIRYGPHHRDGDD